MRSVQFSPTWAKATSSVSGAGHLVGLHGGASDVLLLVVGGAGGDIFVDDESP